MDSPDGDMRRHFLLKTIGGYFLLSEEQMAQLYERNELNDFLDDPNCRVLCARSNTEFGLVLEQKLLFEDDDSHILVFYKVLPVSVTPENLHKTVTFTTILESPVASLHQCLTNVYVPTIIKNPKWSKRLDAKAYEGIVQLQSNLETQIRKRQGPRVAKIEGVLTVEDEEKVWSEALKAAKDKEMVDMLEPVLDIIEGINIELKQCKDWSSGVDAFNGITGYLQDLWKLGDDYYNGQRLYHLLDVISNQVTHIIQDSMKGIDVFVMSFPEVEKHLNWGTQMCEKSNEMCRRLTTTLWPNPDADGRLFEDGEYIPAITKKYHTRFNEILRVRSVHKQLKTLLPTSDTETLHEKKCFASFKGINPVHYNTYTEPKWQAAIVLFDKTLVPAEAAISTKLRTKLNAALNSLQLMMEFKRYKDLIIRPKVSFDLRSSREHFLRELHKMVQGCSKILAAKDFSLAAPYANQLIANMYYVRQIRDKVEEVEIMSAAILSDLPEYTRLKGSIADVVQAIEDFETESFDEWVNSIEGDVSLDDLCMQTDTSVVRFNDKTRLMEVNFNQKLRPLIEDTQQLIILGYRVPPLVADLVNMAKLYMKHAQDLDQTANFHNTIGDRMIPSLRPIMLDTAIALSKMVQGQNSISWNNLDEVDEYSKKLKTVVNKIAQQNAELGVMHFQIKKKVLALLRTDLFPETEKWNDTLRDIRKLFSDAELNGYKNTKTWKNHWEYQVYKAMEVQYTKGLLEIHTKLPSINLEIIYRERKLQFKPTLEEARTKYYANLRGFICIPLTFQGIVTDGEENIYDTLLQTNAHQFSGIFKDAEELFKKVDDIKGRFVEWVALGSSDIEEVSRQRLRTAEDWDQNFSISKAKGQEILRLPIDDETIGCFKISFGLLRMEIELLNRKYWDILSALLQNSVMSQMVNAEAFLSGAITELRVHPNTVEEITKAKKLKDKLVAEIPKIKELLQDIDKKNNTLSTWTKVRLNVNRIKSMWDNFTSLLENHQIIIGHQVQNVKMSIENDITRLTGEIEHFKIRWDQLKPRDEDIRIHSEKFQQMINFIKDRKAEWTDILERKKNLSESCAKLDIGGAGFPQVEEIEGDLTQYELVWLKLEEFRKGFQEFADEDWIIFRTKPFRFDEFLLTWEGKFRNDMKANFVVQVLKEIEGFKTIVPNIKYIRGDSFTEKHWYELFQMLGMPTKELGDLKVSDFLNVQENIIIHFKQLKELNSRAVGEITVRQALNELDSWEVEAKFILSENTDSHNKTVKIIQDFKTILSKVGDNQSLLQSIKTSPFYNYFIDRINVWELRLSELDQYLNSLSKIQRRWIYLEPIFSHGVLDNEQIRFRKIDEEFRSITEAISADNKVSVLTKIPNIRSRLDTLLDQLSRCQNSLNEFLERKRSGFPRFYFLGDDDLLEILGQSTKPSVIQAHLKKLFAGIYSVGFDDENQHILSMGSLEGEIVPLKSKVKITSNVEEWLSELSNEMKYTLKSFLLDCVSESKNDKKNPDKYPAQILSLCNSIVFTDRCEESIRSSRLKELLSQLRDELDEYTNTDVSEKHPNPVVMEMKLKDLILDVIHQIDVVECLIKEKIQSVTDWIWQKQLRFYIREDGSALVKMADAEMPYSYEYQGNAQKLVYTPLLDKCFLTLTQGMRMGLGGNPYGPAGTGKTESVKALGGFLGRQVLVFNCDEGIDVKAIGRIFIGLVKCGAWGCFDEFNRLEGATLSAVSVQIQPIQSALKAGDTDVRLMDETVSLDSNTGIFVTLNPAGKGYGGRNKLPDNLKQLFRPVVMSSPDNDLIAEVILLTEGFKHAKRIGHKLVEVYTLATRVLTPQKHYDWGLRALKTVLKGCGHTLRDFKKKQDTLSEKDESDIVVSTLRLNTLPKLTYSDSFRFDHLIKDVFADVTFKDLGYDNLAQNVRQACIDMRLHPNENQVRKCLELFEQLQQRMGVVVVGPPCCGKTTICLLLKKALIRMGMSMKTHVINPKSMNKSHLLGHINLDTRQWTDGVLTLKAQQVYAEPADVTSWIILDGDIDPEWIESLNSVLDDNRLLTLPSGWRIKFGPNVNFLFETHDLSYASPATISRMGMIFMSDEDSDVKGVVSSWLENEPEETQRILPQLIDNYFYQGLTWVCQQTDSVIQLSTISIVKNALSQMYGIKTISHLAVAMIHGLSGHLGHEARIQFAKLVLEWTQQNVQAEPNDLLTLYYDPKTDRIEVYQDSNLTDYTTEIQTSHLPLVRTASVRQILSQIKAWLQEVPQAFVLVGPEGCGKTMILEHAFEKLKSTEVATIHCSSLTSPQQVLQKLSQVCITNTTIHGRVYKPKSGARLILYFKDINLVKPDNWGTCQLVQLLHQIITYEGFYDTSLEWVGLRGVQIVASITVGNTAGRYALSPRFTSITRLYAVSEPHKNQLTTIYRSYLSLYFTTKHPDNQVSASSTQISGIALAIVTFFESVRKAFSQLTQNHYQFTPRDLTNWVSGIMRYELETVEKNQFEDIIQVWASEACRLFRDKLVSDDDKATFDSLLETTLKNEWNITDMKSRLEGSHFLSGYARSTTASNSNTTSIGVAPGPTLSKVSSEQLVQIVERGSSQFSREYRDLNIVIFPEVLDNVAHFDRILSAPFASMVLAGRAGVGRRTAISVVSSLHGATLFTLKVGRNYSIKQFKNDLKTAIQMSAVEGNKVFFMVEDFQLIEDVFLDMLNSLLSSGEVPGLYSPDELDTMISPLRELAAAEGYTSSLTSFFALRVKKLMHLILIMDYTNTDFRRKCESNPAIYKQCSMLWLDVWSCSTLQLLPKLIIYKFYRKEDETAVLNMQYPSEVEDEEFMKGFQLIYTSLDPQLASPRRFIAFIHTFATLENKRRKLIFERTAKLKAGVNKLQDARNLVEKLKVEASTQEIVLAEKQAEANNALEQITHTMRNANIQRSEMEELREKTLKENEILLIKKKAIDEELKEIGPLVQQAMSSVGNIKNESLSEIRSLRAPPDTIRDILEGVLRLMGIMDMSWNSMKNFLAQRGVKEDIRNFDAHNIKRENRNAVEKLLRERADSFDQKNAKRASAAAAPLATWVVANVKFSRVLEKIEPLEAQQNLLEQNLKMAEGQIGLLSSELLDVDQRVHELKGHLNQYTKEAAQIEIHLNNAKTTLLAAEGLVGKLLDEFERWNEQLNELEDELRELPMKARFAAAFMTYLSDATEDTRVKYMELWLELFPNQNFDFCQFMSDEQERLFFQNNGLPSDRLSYENAIIINQTTLRPYLIDPSSRATEWLKTTIANRTIITISLRDPKFSTELELAVRFGKVLIIYEADEIEPILIPILRGDVICQGSRDLIQIADKFVDYNSEFRIFLCTRNPSPILPPDTASVVTIINFTTTRAGLTTQLLAKTLSIEKPELETKKTSLVKQTTTLKEQLGKLGEVLLQELANAQGNILTNEDLLSSLNKTKTKSLAIRNALSETSLVENALNKEIDVYLPLAEFGSNLYFAVIDVTRLNRMYRFSLFSFMSLFTVNLKTNKITGSMESKMAYLQMDLEKSVYEFVCRSLFKTDRLAFSLHMVRNMRPTLFQPDEWEAFTGQLVVDLKTDPMGNMKETIPSWISEDRSFAVMLLRVAFPELYETLGLANAEAWAEFIRNPDCEGYIPQTAKANLTPFQVLMVVQTLRPDRLHSSMTTFARQALGRKSLYPPPTNLRDVYKIATSSEPVLILTSPGADPSQELRELAVNIVGSQKYSEIPMGQGNGDAILKTLRQAAREGTWICLTNLHLVTHWLHQLDKELHELDVNPEFRLWLTSEPHDQFPTVLAYNCLKVAYEAPEGLKKNLQRTYSNWSENFIAGNKNILRSQSLFALAFFHAIVQERRTYIPQGWSKFYEYNESDLRAGVDVLEGIFGGSRTKEIQWQYVQGIFENAIYGGRVDNIYDNRVLVSYLHDYFNESLVSGTHSSRKLLGAGIKMPASSNYQDYITAIDCIPESDKPSYFGLPSNIERSWQRTVSGQVIAQLKALSLSFSSDIIYDQSIWNRELNPILNIWKKINHTHGTANLLQAKLKPPAVQDSPIDPIEAFVGLEYHNAVTFIQSVHRYLGIISKVLRGTVVPTFETITLANSLLRRETPAEWLKTWDGPAEAPEFLQGIVQRVASIQQWVAKVDNDVLLKEPLNLCDLFNPESFLSAFKQQCARKLKISMDELGFVCAWSKSSVPPNKLTCKLTGLLLEGCSFNGVKLVENTAESAPIIKVPDCTIAWVPQKEIETRRVGELISVPLYYNETRQKLIGSLDFPSYGENVKWVQAGVGLFLST